MTSVAPRVVDWASNQRQLEYVNKLALQEILSLYNAISSFDPHQASQYLLDAVPDVVLEHHGVATELSLAWWEDLFDGVDTPPPTTPPPPPVEQLKIQTNWANSMLYAGKSPMVRLASVAKQHVYGAQRNLVAENSSKLNVGFARMAKSNACDFCRVLASRGAVYSTEAGAQYVGLSSENKKSRIRGVRREGQRYHDHCRCTVAPAAEHLDLNLPSYYDKFNEEYLAAVSLLDKSQSASGRVYTMSNVTAAMRELRRAG